MLSKRRATLALTFALLLGVGVPSMAIERPKYQVELSTPPLEIRDYASTIVAAVHVEGERSAAVNAGFRILANYIFGGNQPQAAGAQTAPAKGESIAMTAPVEQQAKRGGWEVRFTMPAAYTLRTLPRPKDDRIQLLEIPRHRVAVNKFSGFWSDANLRSHEMQLLQWVGAQKLTAVSAPSYAYYDPPWTPWFMRTIEVMVDIAQNWALNVMKPIRGAIGYAWQPPVLLVTAYKLCRVLCIADDRNN